MLTATLMRSTSGLARQQEAARVTEEALGLGRYGKVPTIRHSSRISPDNERRPEGELDAAVPALDHGCAETHDLATTSSWNRRMASTVSAAKLKSIAFTPSSRMARRSSMISALLPENRNRSPLSAFAGAEAPWRWTRKASATLAGSRPTSAASLRRRSTAAR